MRLLVTLLVLGLVGCSSLPTAVPPATEIAPFSGNWSGRELPDGWQPWLISRTKSPTRYELVVDPARQSVVVRALADKAASGLAQALDVDPAQRPRLAWSWRVSHLVEGADNTDPLAEDSPVRLMLFFDGDKSSLPFKEQVLMETAQMLVGRELPYATLMYVWENRQPVDTVITNAHTQQVKMIVAGSGSDRLGQWRSIERDYVADYRRAFGADPGRLIGVGILSDTDNTGQRVEAWYGDIRLLPRRQTAAN